MKIWLSRNVCDIKKMKVTFSIHFTETFSAVLKNIVCYIKESIKQRFVSSRFYTNCKKMKTRNALFINNKIEVI